MLLKHIKCAGVLLGLAAAQQAGAFTLWGPVEAWQTPDLDYSSPAGAIRYYYHFVEPGADDHEPGAPKNFGEGSRLTTPIVTYGYDDTFLQYFGTKGVAAVDSAMAVLNALPSYSRANLANYLTDGNEQVNYTAQALELLDIKSTVLFLMAEHMGLMGETHVWDLAGRAKYATPACAYEYFTVDRNYDPITYDPTAYVNGRLIDFFIWDGCAQAVNVGDAIEFPADTGAPRYTSVATGGGLQFGAYYLGMTRDDVGGLKYLYNPAHYAFQSLDSNSVVSTFTSSWMPVGTNAITGISNFDGLIGGAGKITFIKVAFDSLLNPGFTPITYTYSMPFVTNSKLTQVKVSRTITQPDVLFTAAFLVGAGPPLMLSDFARSGTIIPTTYASPGGGVTPSTIAANELITLNNVGPIYYNYDPFFLDSLNYFAYPVFNWGTFDGSTNTPIVYPQGSSLAALEAEVLQGGAPLPISPWAPVVTTSTNTTTGTGAGGGAGAGAGQ
ncbi:MAG TPA: hypothetical protein VGO59_17555 [Verrucomicrobiae bacterium]|jgi:hypothetical protein